MMQFYVVVAGGCCSVDSSEVHAWEARRAFASAIAGGEAAARVGEAALWVSAEDDAIGG